MRTPSGWKPEELEECETLNIECLISDLVRSLFGSWYSDGESWLDIWLLSLPPELFVKASKGQKRAAAMVFAKSLILIILRMQQSK